MSAVSEAVQAVLTALRMVDGVRVYETPGATVDPPGVVLGPPELTWGAQCSGPTEARFLVYVVEDNDEHALERLWDLTPTVAEALDELPNVVVNRALPGSYLNAAELPSYEIEIEVSL